jgi:hypothetical protein
MSCYSFMENTKLSLTTRNAQNIFADCSIFIKMPIKLENCRLYNHNTLKITAKNIQTVYYRQNRKRSTTIQCHSQFLQCTEEVPRAEIVNFDYNSEFD